MAPRPEFESGVDRYVSTRIGSIPSPTTVTNAARPPPKSPHHPRWGSNYDHRGKPIQAAATPAPTPEGAGLRRRSLGEMGKNVLACTAPANDASPQYVKTFVSSNMNGCYDTTVAAAGDFAVTTSAIYRQECRSDGRGRENLRSGTKRIVSGKKGNKGTLALTDDNSVTESFQAAERRETNWEDTRGTKAVSLGGPKDPAGTPPGKVFQLDTSGTKMVDRFFEFSPPRVVRKTASAEFDPRADPGNIVEARMELFRLGQDGVTPPESKLTRALQDLKRQDKVIDGWKRQLEMAQKHLDDTCAELEYTKKESQEKQRKTAEMRTRAIQERKKVQDLYEAEAERRTMLEEAVAKLQGEISTLKVTLRNARNTSASESSSTRDASDSASQSQTIAYKAEIVDLRSQLAEAHAVTVNDKSVLHAKSEDDELNRKLSEAERELEALRSKDEDIQAVRRNYEDSIRLLNDKIQRMEKEFETTRAKLEENLKAAIEEENQVRSELNKFKANCQRLERERSRARIHSSGEGERLNKQLTSAKLEAVSLKEQLSSEQTANKEAKDKLEQEIADLRKTLRDSGTERSDNATKDPSRLESEVKILKEEVEMRKQQLKVKSEETSAQASRIAELESFSKDIGSKSLQQMQNLEEEVKSLRSKEESLRNELASQHSLLEQERKQTTKAQSLLKAQYVNESVRLEQLRREIEEYKEADNKRIEQEEIIAQLRRDIIGLETKLEEFQSNAAINNDMEAKVRAAEMVHQHEMSILKAKLSEAETKYGEECIRAEKERSLRSENNARHDLELEDMRRDNEKAAEEKMKLREELEELRKLLASGITGAMGRPLATTESFEQSSKVNKLRSDLAVARARLVAAREQTGQFAKAPTSPTVSLVKAFDGNVSCEASVSSLGSSWVPKGSHDSPSRNQFARLKEKTPCLDEVKELKNATLYDISIEEKKEDFPLQQIAVDDEASVDEPGEVTMNTVSSRKSLSYCQTSLIDDEDDDEEALPESSRPPRPPTVVGHKPVTPSRSIPSRASVDELRRQLRESSKRLEQANSRLSSLADQDLPNPSTVNFFSSSPFRGINHNMISSLEDPHTIGGIVEEMVTSEDDAIEVQQVRYADI
jgi:hypothetical protein